ncbi:hypothetical protein ASD32_14570 [Rhizobium sp. Root483D2]|nr:hypothetical protein ASD32_14570 [Rhizobium sp. Root483D2]
MVLGVAVAAAILNISQLSRGGASLSPADFRWSFLVIGAIGMAASLRYLSLRKDAGAEVSGHKTD